MLLPGTCLGNGVIVGANAVVKGTFPDGAILAGNPARIVGDNKRLLEKHLLKGDISYWRGENYDEFEPVWPKMREASQVRIDKDGTEEL